MRRAWIVALIVAALMTSAAGPARAGTTRDSFEIASAHARWSRIAFAAGGASRTVTIADVNRYDEEVWIDLVTTVELCDGSACVLQRRGEGFAFGVSADLEASARGATYANAVAVTWTGPTGLVLGISTEDVVLSWAPSTRLDRDTSRTPIDDCAVARTRSFEGPAIASGTIGGDPTGESLDATMSVEYTTHVFRGC